MTTTVELINGPLHSINKVTKKVEDLSTKISDSTENFLDKNKMAMGAASALMAVTKAKKNSEPKAKRKRRTKSDEGSE